MLSIESLNRRFGRREVVRSLDLAVEPGQRVALWGPNGSGKSTVLRCVAGTLVPSAGSVRIGGHQAGELAARRLVGASLSQERSFYLRLSGRTNLLFFARMRYDNRREGVRSVDALIEELEIADIAAQRVDRCSTGMVQQLGIARALLGDPVVLSAGRANAVVGRRGKGPPVVRSRASSACGGSDRNPSRRGREAL